VVVALAVGGYLWWRRRQAHTRAAAAWHAQLAGAAANAKATRDLLHEEAGEPIEADRLESLRQQANAAADELGRLGAAAPDDTARTRTQSTEQALRSYMTAVDSEQLIRTQTPPASEDALADANVTRRARADELDTAIAGLDELQQSTEG
jgi:hypothetical protein